MVSDVVRKQAEEMSSGLATLAEPHRLLILRQLRRGPRTAGALARALDVPAPLASHHLGVLLDAGLVERRKVGAFVCYTVRRDRLRLLHDRVGRMAGLLGAAAAHADAVGERDPC